MKCSCGNDDNFDVVNSVYYCHFCGKRITKAKSPQATNKSELEPLFWGLLRMLAPDLPLPETQKTGLIPGKNYAVDFYYPGICIEIDGGQFKPFGGRHSRDSDRKKINQLEILGYCVLRYSGEMLKADPQAVIDDIRRAIALRRKNPPVIYKSTTPD